MNASFNEFRTLPTDFLKYINLENKDEIDKNDLIIDEIKQYDPKYIIFYDNDFKNLKFHRTQNSKSFMKKMLAK